MKSYLVALEITSVEIGKTYNGLPLHCTLVNWFQTNKIEYLITDIQKLLESQPPVLLKVGNEDQFTGMTSSGPIPVRVNKVQKTRAIKKLHDEIVAMLKAYDVDFVAPQYLNEGYVPHITHQEDGRAQQGDAIGVDSLFVAEADDAAYGNPRKIIYTGNFGEKEQV